MARSDPEKRPLTEAAIRLGAELNRRTRRLAECSVGHFRFTVERGAEAVWLRARREGQEGGFALWLCPFGPDATLRRKRRG